MSIEASFRPTWVNFALILLSLVRILFGSLLDGGILFLLGAAVVGFVAWLCGVESPRDAAVTGGAIIGTLWALGVFLYKIIMWVQLVRDELHRQKIQSILEGP